MINYFYFWKPITFELYYVHDIIANNKIKLSKISNSLDHDKEDVLSFLCIILHYIFVIVILYICTCEKYMKAIKKSE